MALIALSGVEMGKYAQSNKRMGAAGDFTSDGTIIDTTAPTPSSGFDWTNIFGSLLNAAPSLIKATQPTPVYSYGTPVTTAKPATATTGISTNTLLLIAAAGLGVYFYTRKKRR